MVTEAQILANRIAQSAIRATSDQRQATNYAKQSQFAGYSNECKLCYNKGI